MIVRKEHFDIRPYRIPNQDEAKDFQDFINFWENKMLLQLLGSSLYEAFTAGIAEESPEEQWMKLENGSTYEIDGVQYEYGGVVALLRPCIYAMWIVEVRDKVQSAGVSTINLTNAKRVTGDRRVVTAWNDYVALVGDRCNLKNTLYGFMKTNEADYPNWKFIQQETINNFGI